MKTSRPPDLLHIVLGVVTLAHPSSLSRISTRRIDRSSSTITIMSQPSPKFILCPPKIYLLVGVLSIHAADTRPTMAEQERFDADAMAEVIFDESYMATSVIGSHTASPATSTATPSLVNGDYADFMQRGDTEASPPAEATITTSPCLTRKHHAHLAAASAPVDKQDVGGTQAAAVDAADAASLEDPAVGACPPRGESGGVAAAAPPPSLTGTVAIGGPPEVAPFGHAIIIEEHVKAVADEIISVSAPDSVGASGTADTVKVSAVTRGQATAGGYRPFLDSSRAEEGRPGRDKGLPALTVTSANGFAPGDGSRMALGCSGGGGAGSPIAGLSLASKEDRSKTRAGDSSSTIEVKRRTAADGKGVVDEVVHGGPSAKPSGSRSDWGADDAGGSDGFLVLSGGQSSMVDLTETLPVLPEASSASLSHAAEVSENSRSGRRFTADAASSSLTSSPPEEYVLLQEQQREGEEQVRAQMILNVSTGIGDDGGRVAGNERARGTAFGNADVRSTQPTASTAGGRGRGGSVKVAHDSPAWRERTVPKTTLDGGGCPPSPSPSCEIAQVCLTDQRQENDDDDDGVLWPARVQGPGLPEELGGWGHVDGGGRLADEDAHDDASCSTFHGGNTESQRTGVGGGGEVGVGERVSGGGKGQGGHATDVVVEPKGDHGGDGDDDNGDSLLFVLGDLDGEEAHGMKPLDGLPGERSLYMTGGSGDGGDGGWAPDPALDVDVDDDSSQEVCREGDAVAAGAATGIFASLLLGSSSGGDDGDNNDDDNVANIHGTGEGRTFNNEDESEEEEGEDVVLEHTWDDLVAGVADDGVLHGHGRGGLPDPLLADHVTDGEEDDRGKCGHGGSVVAAVDSNDNEGSDGGGDGDGGGGEDKISSEGGVCSDDENYLSSCEGQPGKSLSCSFVSFRFGLVRLL